MDIELDERLPRPLFVQIAQAIVAEIRRGRLQPGARLAGSRALARTLDVHRNTVLAAYNELVAEGWIVSEPARGTFVSDELPDSKPTRRAPASRLRGVGFPIERRLPPRDEIRGRGCCDVPAGALFLSGGIPDSRLIPVAELTRAYRRTLKRHGHTLLEYGDPQGLARLRSALATLLAEKRGVVASPEELLVTRGSQMAIYLLGRTLLESGDVVLVEEYGYAPAWESLRQSGATLVPMPLDGDGLVVSAVERWIDEHGPPRAIYLTPHHQYPTMATLCGPRRLRLLDLARQHKFAIIEDDYDHEIHYEGRPVLPLAASDRHGVVVYVGTMSKVLAPGLRIGYVVAPRSLIETLTTYRLYVDHLGDHATESAVAELIEDGEIQRHTWRMKRAYQTRRDVLVHELERQLGDVLSFSPPSGGLALWASVDRSVRLREWETRAANAGVVFAPAYHFTFSGRDRSFARIGFGAVDEAEIKRAVGIMRNTLVG